MSDRELNCIQHGMSESFEHRIEIRPVKSKISDVPSFTNGIMFFRGQRFFRMLKPSGKEAIVEPDKACRNNVAETASTEMISDYSGRHGMEGPSCRMQRRRRDLPCSQRSPLGSQDADDRF